jgi:hypothetical protein
VFDANTIPDCGKLERKIVRLCADFCKSVEAADAAKCSAQKLIQLRAVRKAVRKE